MICYNKLMPRLATNTEPLTFEQYLKLEEAAITRHEFVDGFMFAMAGATKFHNVIAGNIFIRAKLAARASKNCAAYMENVKVRTPSGIGYYPDVVVTCDDDVNDLLIYNPCLIVEVLSSSTEDIDRSEKLFNYRKFSSLKMYALVRQDKKFLEVYKRNADDTWQYSILEEVGSLEFSCADFSMTLEKIYEDVIFESPES
jgi:Uma2 family endonuclease